MLKRLLGILFVLPILLSAQQTITKKEERELRKKKKIEAQHEKVVAAVKDTVFNFFPYKVVSSYKTGNDGGMFTISKDDLTFFNVYIPNALSDPKSRIESHYTKITSYKKEYVASTGDLNVSLGFLYNNRPYLFIFKKEKYEKWAEAKLYNGPQLVCTYKGPLKP